MNVMVCVSRVPDTASRIQIDGSGNKISDAGIKYIVNPYDEFALEEGIRLTEKNGGEVTAVTVGDDKAQDVLRTALAMGAHKATLVEGLDDVSNKAAIVASLAEVAKELNPDIIILGRQSIDFDNYQTASMLAAHLDMPSISVVSKLEIEGSTVKADRDVEGGKEHLETSLPAVISVQKGINDPRYPKLPQIMQAKRKPIDKKQVASVEADYEIVSMSMPTSSRVGMIVGDSEADIDKVVNALHQDAKVI
ncbi:MAG: electron transfer flavoprotein subunit beta/FixA family protein [Candidatus Kapaibacteriales bacterium]